ncbi:hypothetical protein SGPA1_50716 [Streptomyces misionensis JCM 4497]
MAVRLRRPRVRRGRRRLQPAEHADGPGLPRRRPAGRPPRLGPDAAADLRRAHLRGAGGRGLPRPRVLAVRRAHGADRDLRPHGQRHREHHRADGHRPRHARPGDVPVHDGLHGRHPARRPGDRLDHRHLRRPGRLRPRRCRLRARGRHHRPDPRPRRRPAAVGRLARGAPAPALRPARARGTRHGRVTVSRGVRLPHPPGRHLPRPAVLAGGSGAPEPLALVGGHQPAVAARGAVHSQRRDPRPPDRLDRSSWR